MSTNDVVLVNTAPVARERDARDATLTGGGGLAKSVKRVEGNSLDLTSATEFIATVEWALPIRECLAAAAISVTKKGLVGEALGPVPVKGLVGEALGNVPVKGLVGAMAGPLLAKALTTTASAGPVTITGLEGEAAGPVTIKGLVGEAAGPVTITGLV